MIIRPGFDGSRQRTIDLVSRPEVQARLEGSAPLRAARARFVAGPHVDDAVRVADDLGRTGRRTDIQPLCLRPEGPADLRANRELCREAVAAAGRGSAGLRRDRAIGACLSPDHLGLGLVDEAELVDVLSELVSSALEQGTGVTLRTGAPQHVELLHRAVATVAADLGTAADLAAGTPPLRVSVLARRHRSEADCARLTGAGIPVRLVRGGSREPAGTAWSDRHEADLAFVRCLSVLVAGGPRPMVATQDPTLLEVTDALAEHHGRQREIEYQMYLGAQPGRQVRTADAGHRLRVLVPYGPGWYDYLADLAERPSTPTRLLTMLVGRG